MSYPVNVNSFCIDATDVFFDGTYSRSSWLPWNSCCVNSFLLFSLVGLVDGASEADRLRYREAVFEPMPWLRISALESCFSNVKFSFSSLSESTDNVCSSISTIVECVSDVSCRVFNANAILWTQDNHPK